MPPDPQSTFGFFSAQRAFIQPQLKQIVSCLTNRTRRLQIEDAHNLVTIQIGTNRVELFLLTQLREPVFKIINRELQAIHLATVTSGDISADQQQQLLELLAGITRKAAHRRIGPPSLLIVVEPHMQLNQPRHRLNGVVVEAQLVEPLARHPRTLPIVTVEGDPATGNKLPCGRFPDIVQQRRQPQLQISIPTAFTLKRNSVFEHLDRMLIHILMLMRIVTLQLQRRQLRQHQLGKPGLNEQLNTGARRIGEQKFDQLIPHPLERNIVDARRQVNHRRKRIPVEMKTQLRSEPQRAHHPQRIIPKRHLRINRGAQHTVQQVIKPASWINQLELRQRQGKRINGEITPMQIARKRITKRHHRLARLPVIHIGAIGGHLNLLTVDARTNRAELTADIPVGAGNRTHNLNDLIRSRIGGEIKIGDRLTEKRIPHRPTNQRQLVPGISKRRGERRHGLGCGQVTKPSHGCLDVLHPVILRGTPKLNAMYDAPLLRAPRTNCGRARPRVAVILTLFVLLVAGLPWQLGTAATASALAADTTAASATADDTADADKTETPPLEAALLLDHNGRIDPASDKLTGSVVLRNNTEQPLRTGTIRYQLRPQPLGGIADYDAWASGGDTTQELTTLHNAKTPEIAAGKTATVPFSIDLETAELPWDAEADTFGVYGITADWRAGNEQAQGRAALINGKLTGSAITLTTVVPVVAPMGDSALLNASQLNNLTGPDGELTQLLDAIGSHQVTLAIDPRLIASIRALGNDAPESALNWLKELESRNLPAFPLEFADANLALQARSGLNAPLAPTGFQFVSDKHELPEIEVDAAPQPTGTAPGNTNATEPTGTEPPNNTKPAPDPDDVAVLTQFSYSSDLHYLPGPGLDNETLPTLLEWRSGRFMIDSDRLSGTDRCTTQVSLGGRETIVANSAVSEQLATSASADTTRAAAARNDALAQLALTAGSEQPCQLVAALPRAHLKLHEGLSELLGDAEAIGAITPAPLPESANAGELTDAELDPQPLADDTIAKLRTAIDNEQAGLNYVSLYDNPTGTKQQLRTELIRLTSASWHDDPDGLNTAARNYTTFAIGARDGVRIVSGAEAQLIGHELTLPVFIENTTSRRVTVNVSLRAQTGHLRAESPATVTIEPRSNARAQLPVTAITNGTTKVELHLTTPDGTQLPSSAVLQVNIHAEVETVVQWLLIGGATALVILGTFRMVRRRSRRAGRAQLRAKVQERRRGKPSATDTQPGDSIPEPPTTPHPEPN